MLNLIDEHTRESLLVRPERRWSSAKSYAGATLNFSDRSGTKRGTVRILRIFNRLSISSTRSSAAIYI